MKKIEVEEGEDMNKVYPLIQLANVIITMSDGKVYESGNTRAMWEDPDLPSDKDIQEKFDQLTEDVIGKEKSNKLKELILNVSKEDDFVLKYIELSLA